MPRKVRSSSWKEAHLWVPLRPCEEGPAGPGPTAHQVPPCHRPPGVAVLPLKRFALTGGAGIPRSRAPCGTFGISRARCAHCSQRPVTLASDLGFPSPTGSLTSLFVRLPCGGVGVSISLMCK